MSTLGLRVTEVVTLSWGDMDVTAGTLAVSRKGGKRMELPVAQISPQVQTLLMERRPGHSGWMFPSRRGSHLTADAVRKTITRVCERLGLRHINPHAMRHQFAHRATLDAVPTKALSMALGHSNLAVTDKYQKQLSGVDVIRAGFEGRACSIITSAATN